MFNILTTYSDLFILTGFFFIVFLVFRLLFIKKTMFISLYHITLFCVLFFFAIVGGSVQNDGYREIQEIEKISRLELENKNPEDLNPESREYLEVLRSSDELVDKSEALFLAWLLAFMVEISMLIAMLAKNGYMAVNRFCKRKMALS